MSLNPFKTNESLPPPGKTGFRVPDAAMTNRRCNQ
jgi:hypothetical protein